ncbi:MAG: hypothetical protein Q7R76_03625 [Candidatus Woesearchaeota archaeon]|nr:hypothetical protein [Candidatus Woesearchaeota archaeon]
MGLIGKLVGTAVVVGTIGAGAYFFRDYAGNSPAVQRYLGNTKTAEMLDDAQRQLGSEVYDSTADAVKDITERLGEWRSDVGESWQDYRENAAEARQVQEERP